MPSLQIEKGLLVTGTRQKVVQVSINFVPMRFMPGNDCAADTFERFKVGLWIPVTEFMIPNHRDPRFKELC